MTTRQTVRVRAFAKINLTLHVGARQADGYHSLETVFQSLALHDTLTCTAARGGFVVTCDDPAVPTDATNLVWKAAHGLWRLLGRNGEPHGCRIAIVKQIPVAAGLGGGSADAAATLVALSRLWRGTVDGRDLAELATGLGADVPYFLFGGTTLGLGRGDRLFPLADMEPRWVVLACPPFGVATAEAYRWFDQDPSSAGPTGTGGEAAWESGALEVHNDLQAPVSRRHPEIGALASLLAGAGAEAAAMTGSGSAVFGLFGSEARARRAARAAAAVGAPAIVTRTVSRRACQAMLAGRPPG
ncbi:MAG: 4-(cytidine 5'-diphospho)-2-C-methyl-D-erythritol kinase [Vicinamibacterales bacterium]|nr:4-(cytidine 5'-diphospho)-2-C-methyl-D-erythritol kinase [Vicinamibacterales bacterium]